MLTIVTIIHNKRRKFFARIANDEVEIFNDEVFRCGVIFITNQWITIESEYASSVFIIQVHHREATTKENVDDHNKRKRFSAQLESCIREPWFWFEWLRRSMSKKKARGYCCIDHCFLTIRSEVRSVTHRGAEGVFIAVGTRDWWSGIGDSGWWTRWRVTVMYLWRESWYLEMRKEGFWVCEGNWVCVQIKKKRVTQLRVGLSAT